MKHASILTTLAFALLAMPASAHHAMEVHYNTDESAIVTYTGEVKNFTLLNPHSWLVVTITKGDRQVDWVLETQSGALLSRAGWRFDLLKSGAVVTFTAFPARYEDGAGRLLSLQVGDQLFCSDRCDLVDMKLPEYSLVTVP